MKKLKLLILSVVIMSFTMNLLAFPSHLVEKPDYSGLESYKGYEITDKAFLKQFENDRIKRFIKRSKSKNKFSASEIDRRVNLLRNSIKRTTYYDFSKKHGITDYKVILEKLYPTNKIEYFKYIVHGKALIWLYRNNNVYCLPVEFNKFLQDEKIQLTTENAFEIVKKFIRFFITGDLYFDDIYFTEEKPNFETSTKYNLIVKTHGKSDTQKLKWGFKCDFESGNLSNFYYQNPKQIERGQARSISLPRISSNTDRMGESEIYWVKSSEEIRIETDEYHNILNDLQLEGFKEAFGDVWQPREVVIRKENGVSTNPKIKIKHDYPGFDYKIFYSYQCESDSNLNFSLKESGSVTGSEYLYNLPQNSTGIWKIEVTHNSDMKKYYFQVFDAITGSLTGYSDGYRIYYRDNDYKSRYSFGTIYEIAHEIENNINTVNDTFVVNNDLPTPKNVDIDDHYDIYISEDGSPQNKAWVYDFDNTPQAQGKMFKYISYSPEQIEDNLITDLYLNLSDAIKVSLPHEFFHSIQANYPNIFQKFGSYEDIQFITEGQAVFAQTFMQEALEDDLYKSYYAYSYYYLKNKLNIDLKENGGYFYGIFWRFLYENYYKNPNTNINSAGRKKRITLIKDFLTGINTLANTESDPVKAFKTTCNNIFNSTGAYNDFDESYIDFANKLLLNNTSFDNWEFKNDDFYVKPEITQSSSGINKQISVTDVKIYQDKISTNLGIDYYMFTFDNNVSSAVFKIVKEVNPDFSISILEMDNDTLFTENNLRMKNFDKGLLSIIRDKSNGAEIDSIAIAITRLDTDNINQSFTEYDLTVYANQVVASGSVSGIWDNNISKVLVNNDVVIDSTETLIIKPGLNVEFQGNHKFIVKGTLIAKGTENAPILFSAKDPEAGWGGIRFDAIDFNGRNDRSKVDYCIFKDGKAEGTYPDNNGGAIYCNLSSTLDVTNSFFYNNFAATGGAICLENHAGIHISNCVFYKNEAQDFGGSISIMNYSNPIIDSSLVVQSKAWGYPPYYNGEGGGIWMYNNSELTANKLTMVNNLSNTDKNSKANSVSYIGGAIHMKDDCYLSMTNSIMRGNYPFGFNFDYTKKIDRACDFDITYSNCEGQEALGIGVIDEDPLFKDAIDKWLPNLDYSVTWDNYPVEDSTKSPCIDSGNPASGLDPDGTPADMGCFTFTQTGTLAAPQNVQIEAANNQVTLTWDPVNSATSYKVYSSSNPNSNFEIDESGNFSNCTWTAPIIENQKFFQITAVNNEKISHNKSKIIKVIKLIENI